MTTAHLFVALFLSAFATLSEGQIITAVQSGSWDSVGTWEGGVLPQTNATVIIPRNFLVTLDGSNSLNVNLLSIQVRGQLRIGSPSIESFRFSSLANLMIFPGAILEDLTSTHLLSLSPNSILSVYPNASFRSSQPTRINSILTGQHATLNATINGPFTLTVDLQGRIESYSSITFVPNQSGDFGLNATWLGGLSPTFDRCSPFSGGCVLLIPREYDVVRYNNRSTINGVDVHIYGRFEISSWEYYWYLYPMMFYVYNGGIFADTTEGGFQFVVNTSIIVYPGGKFLTSLSNRIYSYRDRNVTLSSLKLNRATIVGPYQISIDANGQFNHTGYATSLSTSTSRPNAMLSCYSCLDCGDSKTYQTIQVPADQGYSCRKSSVFGVIDRDAARWCIEGTMDGNSLWCCGTDLCNSTSKLRSLSLLWSFFFFFLSRNS